MEQSSHPESSPYAGPQASEQIPENVISVPKRAELKRRYGFLPRLRRNSRKFWLLLALVTYIAGLGSGYLLWKPSSQEAQEQAAASHASDMQTMAGQVNPQEGYQLPISFGDIGPRMLAAGIIDLNRFVQLYQEMGKPLLREQVDILTQGSDRPVTINADNQHFLLNLLWAIGLSNKNKILTEGPMVQQGRENVVNFASTGGWTLAQKPIIAIYANSPLIQLTEDQQKRLEEASLAVYRPCCDNPTHFPDCNHGMAMLGLLEIMAAQGATAEQMFEAAKYVNAFWFPQQTLEIAVAFKAMEKLDFNQVDASQVVGRNYSSGSGFQAVHQWLSQNGLLQQAPQSGGSCGVK